jgi:hypothetical protein
VTAGCGKDIDTIYGQRKGLAPKSVNGTAVFAEMFEQAGHRVFSWGVLSPRLSEHADCIVWFPDSFDWPSDEVREWLEQWLQEQGGRTLIYVGRDFDAGLWYWEKIEPDVPDDQKAEFQRRKTSAQTEFHSRRMGIPSGDAGWYHIDQKRDPRNVRSLHGNPDWLEGVDPTKLEIELQGRVHPSDDAEVLLESEGDMLISTEPFGESGLIVVANGSFLLNLALVNREHRKLAGRLVHQTGPPRKTVVFLESGPAGPEILENDPSLAPPSGLEIFNVWPTSWVLLHLAVAGIIFCFSRYPIFGRPFAPQMRGTADFGKHVEALGKLVARCRETNYAVTRLSEYKQTIRGDGRKSE